MAGDSNEASALCETRQRRADVADRGLGETAFDLGRGREGRVHQHHGRPERRIEPIVDLLGVVPGDSDLREQVTENPARVSAISFRASRAFASSAKIASSPVPADGSSTRSAGVSIAASAPAKPSAIGVENCWKCSLSSERRVCGASLGETGQHFEHCRWRTRARAHRAAEFPQEQDLGGFERLVGVLPYPRPFGIGAAKRGLHRRAHRAAVEGTPLFQQLGE